MSDADEIDAFAAYAAEKQRERQYPRWGNADARHSRKPRAPKVVQSEADAPMKPSAMEAKQREQSAQMARYKRAKREEHKELLDHPTHGAAYARMVAICKRLPDSAVELVDHVGKGWVRAMSPQHRLVALGMIAAWIMRRREEDGRAPLDDPMPGQPDNLFIICRKKIMGH